MLKGLLLIFCFVIIPAAILADENFTITTYYPSPFGSYNELSTNYLDYGTAPSSVPVLGNFCSKQGQTAYNSTDKKVYLCDGSKWVSMGSSHYTVKRNIGHNFNYRNRVWPGTAAYCNNANDQVIACSGIATNSGTQARCALWYLEPVSAGVGAVDYCLCSSTDPNEDNRLSGCASVIATCVRGGK